MTQHLDEGAIYALLDNEMSPAEEGEARAHLGVCEVCSASFEAASASSLLIRNGLSLLDSPRTAKPFLRPAALAAARRWNGAALGRAAALLLMVGAAASATVPGSPVRSWLEGRGSAERVVAVTAPAPSATAAAPAAALPAAESGVGVAPDMGVLRIAVTDASPGLRIHALLSESPRGGVYAAGGDGSPHFETALGEVEVTAAGVAELRIEIPRSATEASVTINGRRYLAREGSQLRLAADGTLGADLTFEVEP